MWFLSVFYDWCLSNCMLCLILDKRQKVWFLGKSSVMIEKTQASLYVIVDKKYFYLYKKALWKMSEKFLIFQFTKGTHCRLWFVNIKQPRGPVNQHGMLGFHTALITVMFMVPWATNWELLIIYYKYTVMWQRHHSLFTFSVVESQRKQLSTMYSQW